MENPEPPPIPEPIAPSSMQEDAPAGQSRSIPLQRTAAGWALLIFIFAFYMLFTLIPGRPSAISNTKDPFLSEETEIKTGMYQRSLLLAMSKVSPAATIPKKSISDPGVLERIAKKVPTDIRAARLLVEADFEGSKPLDPQALAAIQKSSIDSDRSLYVIYSSKSLSKEQALALTQRLPGTEFTSRLAKVHAYDKAGNGEPRLQFAPVWKGAVSSLAVMAALFLAVVGVILWVVYFNLRSTGKLQPLGHPAEPITQPEADRFAGRAGILMSTFMVINIAVAIYMRSANNHSETISMLLVFPTMLLAVFALHKVPAFGLNIPLSRVGVSLKNWKTDILWGIGGYIATLPFMIIALLIGAALMKVFGQSTHPATELIEAGANGATIFALYISASVVAPIWEEIMFRGTLLPALAKTFGRPLWGILASSFLFAAIHPQGVPLWLGLGSIGAMNGLLAYQTKSLIPSIVLHALNNSLVLALALILS
jgi:membrane protease YdiL (CAAX protease family)